MEGALQSPCCVTRLTKVPNMVENAVLGTSSGLMCYVYLFICLWHVQLGPVGSMSNIMPDHVLIRKGWDVLFRIVILHTEVEHHTQLATFLQHAEHGHCLLSCGRHPPSGTGILVDLLSKFSFQHIGTFRQVIYDSLARINELDLMIHLPEWGKFGGYASDKVCDLVHPLFPQIREFRGWWTTPPQRGLCYIAFMQARAYAVSHIITVSILHFKVHTIYCIRLSTSTDA